MLPRLPISSQMKRKRGDAVGVVFHEMSYHLLALRTGLQRH